MSKSTKSNTAAKVSTTSAKRISATEKTAAKIERKQNNKAELSSARNNPTVNDYADSITDAIKGLQSDIHPAFTRIECRVVAELVRRAIVEHLGAKKIRKARSAKISRWADLTSADIKFGTEVKATRLFEGQETGVSGLFVEMARGLNAQRHGRCTIMTAAGSMKVRLPLDYLGVNA